MDEELNSIRSEESIPNPLYEEIITSDNQKDNNLLLLSINEEISHSTTPHTDITQDSDNEDDDDDDNRSSSSNSGSNSSSENSCSTCSVPVNMKKKKSSNTINDDSNSNQKLNITGINKKVNDDDDEKGNADSNCPSQTSLLKSNNVNNDTTNQTTTTTTTTTTSPLSITTIPETTTPSTSILKSPQIQNVAKLIKATMNDSHKSSNIKLLIKKPQNYEISTSVSSVSGDNTSLATMTSATSTNGAINSPPKIKVQTSTKPIYLVTVVSNTPTGPAYSTATYSPGGLSQAQILQQMANKNTVGASNSSSSSDVQQNTKISIQESSNILSTSSSSSLVSKVQEIGDETKKSKNVTKDAANDANITDTTITTTTTAATAINTNLDVQSSKIKKSPTADNENSTSGNDDKSNLDEKSLQEDLDDVDSIKSDRDQEIKTSTPKIGREFLQLQKTVNESKVLSEYISDSSLTKSRKSKNIIRVPLKHGNDADYSPMISTTLNSRRSRSRSSSKTRIGSPYLENSGNSPLLFKKWPSEERIHKRTNMRSQNTEFVQKHMKFLNRIHADNADTDNSDGEVQSNETKSIPPIESQLDILKRNYLPPPKRGWDAFCWKCTTCGDLIPCSKCIRSYHFKCLKGQKFDKDWICPECAVIENFMKGMTRSSKSNLSVDHLNQLMQFALKRMVQLKGQEKFLEKLDENEYTDYRKYIVNPVTLDTIQKKVEKRHYKCSEELVAEAKWIQHNAAIYYGNNNKLTTLAKQIVKICRQEANEIETCPECYYNANTKKDWFIEVCSKPHILLWAKLKGFPYWPAKSMGSNSSLVNVRFFGAHDRAHVPLKDCYLYSEKDPNPTTKQNKRNLIIGSIKEVDLHIKRIAVKFGTFKYAPFKTLYNPSNELMQLEMMIPGIIEYMENVQASSKPALTYKIVKTADNNLSMIRKTDINGELRSTTTSTSTTNNDDDNSTASSSNMNKINDNNNSNTSINCSGNSILKISKKMNNSNPVMITTSSTINTINNQRNLEKTTLSSSSIVTSNESLLSSSSGSGNISSLNISSSSPSASLLPTKVTTLPSSSSSSLSSNLIKSYEVVSKKSENENSNSTNKLVSTVILKRKSDNWNAIAITTTTTTTTTSSGTQTSKKPKINHDDKDNSIKKNHKDNLDENNLEKFIEKENHAKTTITRTISSTTTTPVSSVPEGKEENQRNAGEKRKLSKDDNDDDDDASFHQPQKIKIISKDNQQSASSMKQGQISLKSSISNSSNINSSTAKSSEKEENSILSIGNSKIVNKSILSAINEDRDKSLRKIDAAGKNDEKQNQEIKNKNEIQKNKNSNDKIIIKVENEENNEDRISNVKNVENVKSNTKQNSEKTNSEISSSSDSISRKSQENQDKSKNTLSESSSTVMVTVPATTTTETTTTQESNNETSQKTTNGTQSNTKSSKKILVNVQQVTQICNLIPFTEIKTENPDNYNENENQNENENVATTDPEFVDVRGKLSTKSTTTTMSNVEQSKQQQSNITTQSSSTNNTNNNNKNNDKSINERAASTKSIENTTNSTTESTTVTIKTEICSDDDNDDPLQMLSSKSSSDSSVLDKTNTNINSISNNLEKQNSQRISVRDFSTLCIQPLAKKIEKKINQTAVTNKFDMKKRYQRARKSFPNRSIMPSPILCTTVPKSSIVQPFTPISKQNINSMVYIPLDTKVTTPSLLQKPVPVPPLTAVSKVSVSNQHQQKPQQPSSSIGNSTALVSSSVALTINGNSSFVPINTNNITITKSITTNTQSLVSSTITTLTSTPSQQLNNPSSALNNSNTSSTTTSSGNNTVNDNELTSVNEQDKQQQHMLSGFVTPSLASAITETIVRSPPKLAPKPTGPLRSDGDFIFPTEAGPVCKTLMENAHKMTDFFRSVIEDTLSDMASSGVLEAKIHLLELEIEKLKHSHHKEITELKHNTDVMLCEMRNSLENEKQRLISETRKQCEFERIRAVEEAKKKQWCANCGKEAQFYCCWNTSYCDYPCQQKHWSRHMNNCAQNDNPDVSAQKVGVKIQALNVKDKTNKSKDVPMPRLPPNTFLRPASVTAQTQRNAVPVHRLVNIPVPISTAPRFTLLNREGNWELMTTTSSQTSFQQLSSNNAISAGNSTGSGNSILKSSAIQSNTARIAETLIRSNKL